MTTNISPSSRHLAAAASPAGSTPSLFAHSPQSAKRLWEFFTANIRNRNTRKAYFVACSKFSAWCAQKKLILEQVQPVHVAAYIEQLMQQHSKPTVKQHLAASLCYSAGW
jgi:integrase/recombinase XerD